MPRQFPHQATAETLAFCGRIYIERPYLPSPFENGLRRRADRADADQPIVLLGKKHELMTTRLGQCQCPPSLPIAFVERAKNFCGCKPSIGLAPDGDVQIGDGRSVIGRSRSNIDIHRQSAAFQHYASQRSYKIERPGNEDPATIF